MECEVAGIGEHTPRRHRPGGGEDGDRGEPHPAATAAQSHDAEHGGEDQQQSDAADSQHGESRHLVDRGRVGRRVA
ncbi:hypothetical protein GS436_05425 [Rhodococcus hoagii]|nr:hypothetical protein [Prescottella equi]